MDLFEFSFLFAENLAERLNSGGSVMVSLCDVDFSKYFGSLQISPIENYEALQPFQPSQVMKNNALKRKAPATIKTVPVKTPRTATQSMSQSFAPKYTTSQEKTQMFVDCMFEGEKAFMCTVCAYKTKVNSNIHRHVRKNHGENLPSFKCTSCDFSTPERSKLKGHYMKVHTLAEAIAKIAADSSVAE